MNNRNVAIVAAENGKQIIDGLNLLALFTIHPFYKEIIKLVLIPQIHKQTGVDCETLTAELKAALGYIDEINKTLSNCDALEIQFGMTIEKKDEKPSEKTK